MTYTDNCAPNVDITDHYTCFDYSELQAIATAFNQFIIDTRNVRRTQVLLEPIDIPNDNTNNDTTDATTSKRHLWNAIYTRLQKVCRYEHCWIDFEFINTIPDRNLRDKIKLFTFKPKMSNRVDNWLSTRDIATILQQYQPLYSTFKSLGAVPSDFYQLNEFDTTLLDSYKKLGIVFNLDDHRGKGSHWVSMIIDNDRKTIEYFDSVGNPPNKNIKRFVSKIYKFLKSRDTPYRYMYNNIQHQYKNSECGVYAVYFIVQRLLGYTFSDIKRRIINDDDMSQFRKIIFTSLTE